MAPDTRPAIRPANAGSRPGAKARWIRRIGALALGLVLGSGCAGSPQPVAFVRGGEQPDTADGLYRVWSTQIPAVFLRPGTRFADYDSVVIDPVTVSYLDEDRSAGRKHRRGNASLADVEIARFKRIFQQSLERELAKSRYEVVSEPGPSVLRIAGHVVDLFVDVPPFRGGDSEFIGAAGEMTLVLDVNDSQSGAPLARIADRRIIMPPGTRLLGLYWNHPVNTWGGIRWILGAWARILRDGLDDFRELPPVPTPGKSAGV